MSDYQFFLHEKDKIDFYIEKGFRILQVKEDLDGAVILFDNPVSGIQESIQIGTADARKYFSGLLIRQKEQSAGQV
ncbi:hypothetical protein LCM00_00955 [Bacillus infantis]|jgi:hypothetical protein|uniref:hypothetical protein n=1 Tax=Bacillus infantis TaxID=324767 RepID=UPI001CD2B67D|nr:hypothetical protein [Bacillus infantis]MCA1038061.1 hypothetical protein [Bacillus infantis]MCR6610870.1 hypothetical protein [Bacillus infantis]